ncbi:Ankyrin repeat domain-containing protein 13C-A [Fasciolopsis buskii]|uniref:Ankyrin repeat domain-containing protein 13C-A n=1 Tax=Fasciolopsis buskii TaxID=27845 RepID=A0A8E0VG44_9TREM|nr:Ankyrin repeat domain-containing protein 13C-A [Fasciolopsis buski]
MISTQPLPSIHNGLDQMPPYVNPLIDQEFPLHYCVFFGLWDDLKRQLVSISAAELNKQDNYGNTALHLAVMLGHRECVAILLAAHCDVSIRNSEGWNPLSEAISYGSISMITKVYQLLRLQMFEPPKLHVFDQTLRSIPDCRLEFEWEISSWSKFV